MKETHKASRALPAQCEHSINIRRQKISNPAIQQLMRAKGKKHISQNDMCTPPNTDFVFDLYNLFGSWFIQSCGCVEICTQPSILQIKNSHRVKTITLCKFNGELYGMRQDCTNFAFKPCTLNPQTEKYEGHAHKLLGCLSCPIFSEQGPTLSQRSSERSRFQVAKPHLGVKPRRLTPLEWFFQM